MHLFLYTFAWHLMMHLIWRKLLFAKTTENNTQPNVKHLQYLSKKLFYIFFDFQNTLTQTQDRAFRRISELKEQIQLDQLAKKDLEENYRLMLEEKDEHLKVFRTQVRT